MPKRQVNEQEKQAIRERVKKEFPGSKCLQEIHYIRYVMELEWQGMSDVEIDNDIKEGARRAKEELEKLLTEL